MQRSALRAAADAETVGQPGEGVLSVDRGSRILALMHELRAMPEYDLVTSLTGFNISIFTFDKNFADLEKLISFLTTDPKAEHLFWVRNRDQLHEILSHIIRLLHNYVASALSLIDHTIRLHRKLHSKPPTFTDYGPRVDSDFTQDPLAQFVKGLRQYCQHYRAPNLSVETSWKAGDENMTRTIWLLKDDLLSFNGWSASAKKFLGTVDKVNVIDVATSYRAKVLEFYRWFQEHQRGIYAPQLRAFREKEAVLLTLMLEDKLDSAFAAKDASLPYEKDELFLSIFSSPEFTDLDRFPIDSPDRASRAIELLEVHFPVPDHIKQGIIRWYAEIGSKS